jgi:hypothetical protein
MVAAKFENLNANVAKGAKNAKGLQNFLFLRLLR